MLQSTHGGVDQQVGRTVFSDVIISLKGGKCFTFKSLSVLLFAFFNKKAKDNIIKCCIWFVHFLSFVSTGLEIPNLTIVIIVIRVIRVCIFKGKVK